MRVLLHGSELSAATAAAALAWVGHHVDWLLHERAFRGQRWPVLTGYAENHR